MHTFRSSKVYDGFSTVFRQWAAEGTHCKYLHGYGVSFKVTFGGELDQRGWVYDFGGLKRAKSLIDGKNPKEWLEWLLDHTTIIAEDDPALERFKELDREGVIQLRILPAVGAERFAEYLYQRLNEFVQDETDGRVKVVRVDFYEHGKNSASYGVEHE
ncbi:MAG TPA: 6-carboxytetrahydropterin synthase [Patescibacteria group bacterium]|nr:6-carboxytetrahydropterin synthase [Patescibacteria group bacterium]